MGIDKMDNVGLQFDDCRPVAKVEENSRSFSLHNPNKYRIRCYRIDGEVIKDSMRCDYGILTDFSDCKTKSEPQDNITPENKQDETHNRQCRFYLIELKGTDLRHAAKQIIATHIYLEKRIQSCIFEARIVLSRVSCPNIRDTSVIELERRLAKTGGSLIKASRFREETLIA